MNPTLLLFDIDGTLLLSGGCGIPSFDQAFQDLFDIPDAWGTTRPDGRTDPSLFGEIAKRHLDRPLTEEEYHGLCSRYTTYFEANLPNADRFRLMPGIPKIIDFLARSPNVYLAVATGNIKAVAQLKLRHANLFSFFKTGGYGCDDSKRTKILQHALKRSRKKFSIHFSPGQTIVIGDTAHDVRAAASCNMRSVGVKTGATKGKDFLETSPDLLLKSFENPRPFLQWLGL